MILFMVEVCRLDQCSPKSTFKVSPQTDTKLGKNDNLGFLETNLTILSLQSVY